MTTTYPFTVAFWKDRGLQEKNDFQPKALILSCQKNKKDFSMARRMTIILQRTNQNQPVLVDILNYQVSLTYSLTATHYREYSKDLSTHLT